MLGFFSARGRTETHCWAMKWIGNTQDDLDFESRTVNRKEDAPNSLKLFWRVSSVSSREYMSGIIILEKPWCSVCLIDASHSSGSKNYTCTELHNAGCRVGSFAIDMLLVMMTCQKYLRQHCTMSHMLKVSYEQCSWRCVLVAWTTAKNWSKSASSSD